MSRKLVVAHLPVFAGMRTCDTYLGDARITVERRLEVTPQDWRMRTRRSPWSMPKRDLYYLSRRS